MGEAAEAIGLGAFVLPPGSVAGDEVRRSLIHSSLVFGSAETRFLSKNRRSPSHPAYRKFRSCK